MRKCCCHATSSCKEFVLVLLSTHYININIYTTQYSQVLYFVQIGIEMVDIVILTLSKGLCGQQKGWIEVFWV